MEMVVAVVVARRRMYNGKRNIMEVSMSRLQDGSDSASTPVTCSRWIGEDVVRSYFCYNQMRVK